MHSQYQERATREDPAIDTLPSLSVPPAPAVGAVQGAGARDRGPGRARRGFGPVAWSLLLHGAALVAVLVWFQAAPQVAPARANLQIAAMEIIESESREADAIEDLNLLEETPEEMDVELPEVEVPEDQPLEDDSLPECSFDAAEPCPAPAPTISPDLTLDVVGESRPRPPVQALSAPVASPPAPAPTRATPAARQPRARPQAKARPAARGRPLKLVHRPDVMRYYPTEARRRGIEGEALVEIRVDGRGVVVDARVVRSSGSLLLDQQAVRLLYDYRFAAGDGGRARVPVNFRLR